MSRTCVFVFLAVGCGGTAFVAPERPDAATPPDLAEPPRPSPSPTPAPARPIETRPGYAFTLDGDGVIVLEPSSYEGGTSPGDTPRPQQDGVLVRYGADWSVPATRLAGGLWARWHGHIARVGDTIIGAEGSNLFTLPLATGVQTVRNIPGVDIDRPYKALASDGTAAYLPGDSYAQRVVRVLPDGTWSTPPMKYPSDRFSPSPHFIVEAGYVYLPMDCSSGNVSVGCPEAGVYRMPVAGGALEKIGDASRTWNEYTSVVSVAVLKDDIYFSIADFEAGSSIIYAGRIGSGQPATPIDTRAATLVELTATEAGVIVSQGAGDLDQLGPVVHIAKGRKRTLVDAARCVTPAYQRGFFYWAEDDRALIHRVRVR